MGPSRGNYDFVCLKIPPLTEAIIQAKIKTLSCQSSRHITASSKHCAFINNGQFLHVGISHWSPNRIVFHASNHLNMLLSNWSSLGLLTLPTEPACHAMEKKLWESDPGFVMF
jgi:hypothetical protein